MKTFTTYAEKKAKQILNLLQGYTKGIRITAILILLLMGVNNAWAYTAHFSLMGNPTPNGWTKDTDFMINTGTGTADEWYIYAYVSKNQYFALNNGSDQYGPTTANKEIKNGSGGGTGNYNSNAWKFVGSSGIIKICCAESNNREWYPYVWVEESAPTIKFKHPWNGSSSWSEQTATKQSDGTYTYDGQYGNKKAFNAGPSGKYKYNESQTTVEGSPSTGDMCRFIWNPVGYVQGGAETKASGTFKIVKLCSLTYNGNGNTGGTVPSATNNQLYNTSITLSSTTLTKNGYTHTGWNTKADGTGDHYDKGASYTLTAVSATLYAEWAENTYSVTISAGNGGTVSPSGSKTIGQVTKTTVTATPNANYEFVNWTATGGVVVANTTSASTTITATATGTLTANFRSTATNFLNVEAGEGIASVTGSTDPVTLGNTYDITATPNTGYTFSTWTANPAANATFGSATTANTTVTVKNGSVTVTASATENMSTLTTSNQYNAGDPGYEVPEASVNSIGYETTATVTATAAGNGYTFTGWTLTNCTRTDGGATNATSITVRSNGDSKAATVVANYAEDLTTSWVLKGSFVDDFATAYEFVKKSGESTGKVAYVSLDLADSKEYQFKVVNGSTWYGNNNSDEKWWITATTNDWVFYSDAGNCHMKSSVAGTYTFKIDFSGTNPKVSVQFPAAYKITYGVGDNKGTDAVSTDPSVSSGSLVLASTEITFSKGTTKAGYTWKNWNSKADGAGTNLGTGDTYVSSNRAGDITVYACYDLVTYNITYNLNGGTNPNNAQTSYNVTTATFKLPNPTKTGYTFAGWFDNEELTGDAVTQITKGTTGDKTFYAKWTPTEYTITYNDLYGVTHSNPETYTIESETITFTNPTSERTGYDFAGWNPTEITKGSTGNKNVTAQWTEILSTITITTNPAEGGYVTVDDESFTPGNTVQVGVTTTCTVTTTANEGYGVAEWEFKGAAEWKGGQNTVTLASDGSGEVGELIANYIPLSRNINFDKQSGEGGTDAATVTYTQNDYSPTSVVAPTRSGYTFGGYYSEANGAGVQIVSAVGEWLSNASGYTDANGNWLKSAENTTLYAKWTAKIYTVTLDQTEAKVEGTTRVTATYNAAMPSATMPTAANGYVFMGYFDGEQGAGTQYYNADGTSAHVWDKAEDATLYAHFAKAEITQITLDKYTFEPVEADGTGFVTATPTIEPTPTNAVVLCWRLLYNNGNPVAGHDAIEVDGNIVKFSIAGLAAGTYKIEAVLRTGNNCGSGEVLSTKTVNFSIASTYTITVKYTCDGKEIMAASKVPAHVSEETEITAPDITGYTFSSWEAGDGVTIKSTNNDKVKITAIYDGYLTAKYTARPMVYFKNTLGWKKVYVYTFSDNAWWDSEIQGVHPNANKLEQGEMTLVEGTTDIYYFELSNPDGDYTQDNNANRNYIAFSDVDMRTYGEFHGNKAIYRGDHKNNLTLFIPQADQNPSTTNQTKYYNKGIWMKYNSTESGYQMPTNNSVNDNPPGLGTDDGQGWSTYGNKFTAQTPGGYKFSITKHLEANKTYEFKIKNYVYVKDWENKDNNEWYGYNENSNTITDSKCTELHFHEESDEKHNCGNAKIKTTAEGEYTFTIDLSQGKVLLSVEYPIEVDDYRVIYKDNATWSKGTAHDVNWYHPSRIIKKNKTAEPTKDIISFFISYGQSTTMQFQRVTNITNGKVTWADAGEARIPDAVNAAGVYNFIVTQTANGASISMADSAEPYTGNYYIRVDALAGKWDNYKTNPENRMTYSAFSESEANSFGEKFSHYATKYCTNGTNIKFTIANDYSPCISDTLVQDVVNPLGNLDSEGTLLSNDMYNANVRFMWNRKTNKISRAYVGPAGEKQSQFLMLRTKDEIQGEAENETLNTSEGDILDAGNSIYAARFADTQNWIYERTVKVKPGTRVKLYASYPKCYHIYVENNTEWSEIALYAWKDGGEQPLGAWPGLRPVRTVEIGGKTYHDFQVNEWVFGSKLKLNNNNNGSETVAFDGIGTAGNYYLKATSSALTKDKYEANVTEANAQYFRGAYDDNNATWNDNNSVVILGGDGDNWNKIRIIYDFKTNRLMAALVPDQEVSGEKTIAADVMIIRKHQDAATSITLTNDNSKLKEVKTVYGSLQLNRWVLNNRNSEKSGIEYCTKKVNNQDTYDENVTNEHHPVLPTGEQKSIYERALYFISFPFDVHLSDVFGFGTYGTHWVISDYNGLRRAQRGYFAEDCINEDCTNWDYIWDPADFVLEANKGYLLSLDLDLMRYDNTDFWLHNIDQVELYFPSTANLATIEKTSYTMSALSEEYLCKINHNTDGTKPDRDRRVKDSYWRCIGVPSFADYDGSLYKSKEDAEANEGEGKDPINWKDDYTWTADESGFPFLYEWNVTDNSLSVQNTSAYQFKPTFAYLVQNGDAIYWKAVNTKPSSPIIARQRTETERNYEWKIALLRNGNQEDQTFVRITDNENVTTAFDFNQDLAKEFNYGRGDIYTLIGYERVAANSMPCSDKTTIIPLGLNIEQAGDYTIAMPEGVENIGITLVDNETGIHTNLSAGQEYTLTLNNGICENRLFIEVSPIQNTPTDLEYTTEDTREQTTRKVLINEKLYIIRDGVVYDAQGHRL